MLIREIAARDRMQRAGIKNNTRQCSGKSGHAGPYWKFTRYTLFPYSINTARALAPASEKGGELTAKKEHRNKVNTNGEIVTRRRTVKKCTNN